MNFRGLKKPQLEQLHQIFWAGLLTLLLVALVYLVNEYFPTAEESGRVLFNKFYQAYNYSVVPLVDTTNQTAAHKAMLVALLFTSALVFYIFRFWVKAQTAKFDQSDFSGNWKFYLPSILILAFFMVPLLYVMYEFDFVLMNGREVYIIETHQACLHGPALRLLAGRNWLDGNPLFYGFLIPSLFAFLRLHFGYPELASDYSNLVKILQVLTFLISSIALILWRKKDWLGNILGIFALFAWAFFGSAIFVPNLSGLRFLGLSLAPLALLLTKNLGSFRRSGVLGAVAGICLLINLETGISVTLGFGFYLLMINQFKNLKSFLQHIGIFTGGILVALIAFAGFLGIGFNDWGFLHRLFTTNLFQLMSAQAGQGEVYKSDWFAVLILAHSLFVFYMAVSQRALGNKSFQNSFVAAIATMILVWFSYYANRASLPYLKSQLLLYAFLVPQLTEGISKFFANKLNIIFGVVKIGLLVGIAIPGIYFFVHDGWSDYSIRAEISEKVAPYVSDASGIMIPTFIKNSILARAEFLKGLPEKNIVYFSSYPWLMPLVSGVDNGLSSPETFALEIDPAEKAVLQKRPKIVLIESATNDELTFIPLEFVQY
jgi:hypothetical protein